MTKKYYHVNYILCFDGNDSHVFDVIDEHPYLWLKDTKESLRKLYKTTKAKILLSGWQEITKEEYEIYQEAVKND